MTSALLSKSRRLTSLSLVLFVSLACRTNSAEQSVAPGANARYATEDGRATALQIFEGDGRDDYQKPEELIRHMSLKEGNVVCEIGAGSGG